MNRAAQESFSGVSSDGLHQRVLDVSSKISAEFNF